MKIGECDLTKKVFIIAEIGVNHNGSVERGKELIAAAVRAGVDAVKTQTWISEELFWDHNCDDFKMAKGLELRYSDFVELKRYADELGVMFLSTPDDDKSLDFLVSIGVPAIKVGSAELNNLPFLKKIASKNLPIILSTGMGSLDMVDRAVRTIVEAGNNELALLHCTSSYPCPLNDVNLNMMKTLEETFKLPVGYSDHTKGCIAGFAAVLAGAQIIEKHFTIDSSDKGPDHAASLEPDELMEFVSTVRSAENLLGCAVKQPVYSEMNNVVRTHKSVVAGRDLRAGEIIRQDDLSFKRPGTGLSPDDAGLVCGHKLLVNKSRDDKILLEDVE